MKSVIGEVELLSAGETLRDGDGEVDSAQQSGRKTITALLSKIGSCTYKMQLRRKRKVTWCNTHTLLDLITNAIILVILFSHS